MWFDSYKEDLKKLLVSVLREEGFMEDECDIVDIAFYGSRTTGRATEESDLDVLVEYKGTAREDVLFDVLAEQGLELEGIPLDLNPIKEEKSGTIEEFLNR